MILVYTKQSRTISSRRDDTVCPAGADQRVGSRLTTDPEDDGDGERDSGEEEVAATGVSGGYAAPVLAARKGVLDAASRNTFDSVPREIEEAARIDGARDFRLLVRVLLPLVMPGVATVAIFAFLNSWNEFLAALILLSDNDKYTLPVLMTAVRAGRLGAINRGAIQAGVMMAIPRLLIFLALQRYYMRGLMAGAVK